MFKFLFNNKKKKDKIITAKVDEHTDLDFTKKVSKEGTNKNKVMNELIKMYNNSEINFLNFNIENENINFSFETQTNIIYHRDMGFLNKIFIDKMLNTKKRNLIIDYCNDLNLEEYANKNKYTIIDMSKIQINILDFKEVSVRDIYNAIKNNDKEFTSNSFFMERGLILLESLIENLKIHQSIYKNTNFYFEEIFEYIDDFEQLITLYKEFDNENKKNNYNI